MKIIGVVLYESSNAAFKSNIGDSIKALPKRFSIYIFNPYKSFSSLRIFIINNF